MAPGDIEAAVRRARAHAGRQGEGEGARLQEACEFILKLGPELTPASRPAAAMLLWRAGLYEAAEALGDLSSLGREAALAGAGDLLLHQLPKVRSHADRLEALAQHGLWAGALERRAAERPIETPARSGGRGRLRIGFLSSDLRVHVVGYFAQPLFQAIDPRFELYVYSSFQGPADVAQQWIASRCAAYRILPPDDREAALVIAHDGIDLLIELGGPTSYNRPGVLAYRPAPLQASWLGYPHSLGLSQMDHFIADPVLAPAVADLLLEKPLLMPTNWICMAPSAFQPQPPLAPDPPVRRNGCITFGTANDPYKFNPRLLRTWARTVAATPGSRFVIIRPEAGAAFFRESVVRHFAEEGVGEGRIEFRAQRGGVRSLYADIDIALDTFPVTGGTTTCEALWMGVPTVTLMGEAVFERMSGSILTNAGLPGLVARTEANFVRLATELAGDADRLGELRRTMRDRIGAHPIGDHRRFVADFYDLLAGVLG